MCHLASKATKLWSLTYLFVPCFQNLEILGLFLPQVSASMWSNISPVSSHSLCLWSGGSSKWEPALRHCGCSQNGRDLRYWRWTFKNYVPFISELHTWGRNKFTWNAFTGTWTVMKFLPSQVAVLSSWILQRGYLIGSLFALLWITSSKCTHESPHPTKIWKWWMGI